MKRQNKGRQKGRTAAHGGNGTVRIIAGEWRGRKIPVADHPGLRPSTDRVRETLFNWLQFDIAGARCVDLFAGAGGLGLEAASRGAKEVLMLEVAPQISRHLQTQVDALGSDRIRVINQDAIHWLQDPHAHAAFDILFLDPPFASSLIHRAINIVAENKLIPPGGMIYIEVPKGTDLKLPPHWQAHRAATAGQVQYGLWRVTEPHQGI